MKKTKRLMTLMLCLCILFSLTACGKSEYVKNTETLIAAIGEVDADSEEAVIAAEKAYDALTDEDKAKVENAVELPLARAALDAALEQKAAEELEALRRALLGTWQLELEMSELLKKALPKEELDLIGDYLQEMPVLFTFTLREDNTYAYGYDEDSFRNYFKVLRDSINTFLIDSLTVSLADALRDEGVSLASEDQAGVEAALGMTIDEFLLKTQGVTIDDLMQLILSDSVVDWAFEVSAREGRFMVEPGKLHLSASLEDSPREGDFENFVLVEDTLTLLDFSGTSMFEIVYPIEFVRVS